MKNAGLINRYFIPAESLLHPGSARLRASSTSAWPLLRLGPARFFHLVDFGFLYFVLVPNLGTPLLRFGTIQFNYYTMKVKIGTRLIISVCKNMHCCLSQVVVYFSSLKIIALFMSPIAVLLRLAKVSWRHHISCIPAYFDIPNQQGIANISYHRAFQCAIISWHPSNF